MSYVNILINVLNYLVFRERFNISIKNLLNFFRYKFVGELVEYLFFNYLLYDEMLNNY